MCISRMSRVTRARAWLAVCVCVQIWDVGSFCELRNLEDRTKGFMGKHKGDVRRILLIDGGRRVVSASVGVT